MLFLFLFAFAHPCAPIFVTFAVPRDLLSPANADALCDAAAATASASTLIQASAPYTAWLSSTSSNAIDRLLSRTSGCVASAFSGAVVFSDVAAIANGSLPLVPIDETAQGSPATAQPGGDAVATATKGNGRFANELVPGTHTCGNWKVGGSGATLFRGLTGSIGPDWTEGFVDPRCDAPTGLICIGSSDSKAPTTTSSSTSSSNRVTTSSTSSAFAGSTYGISRPFDPSPPPRPSPPPPLAPTLPPRSPSSRDSSSNTLVIGLVVLFSVGILAVLVALALYRIHARRKFADAVARGAGSSRGASLSSSSPVVTRHGSRTSLRSRRGSSLVAVVCRGGQTPSLSRAPSGTLASARRYQNVPESKTAAPIASMTHAYGPVAPEYQRAYGRAVPRYAPARPLYSPAEPVENRYLNWR